MNILSWNILSGGFKDYASTNPKPGRFPDLVNVIKEINPDVVSLIDTYRWTEVFTPEELKKAFGYPYAYSVKLNDERLIAKGHDNGITVFSRIPNTVFETIRIVTRNAIKVKAGKYDIFSVYLDDVSEDTRIKQIEEILKLVDHNTPTIITGDLNTIDQNDLIETTTSLDELGRRFPKQINSMVSSLNEMKRGKLTKVLTDNGFTDFGKGKGNTVPAKLFPLPTNRPIVRLDYAFGSKQTNLEEFKVLTDTKYSSSYSDF